MRVTDSQPIYEGIVRPQAVLAFFDGGKNQLENYSHENADDIAILERYFSDIQNLFLKNLSLFLVGTGEDANSIGALSQTESQTLKLRALLEELIKVKALISVHTASVVAPKGPIARQAKPKVVLKRNKSRHPSRSQHRRSK
jgi:hypothetical protein